MRKIIICNTDLMRAEEEEHLLFEIEQCGVEYDIVNDDKIEHHMHHGNACPLKPGARPHDPRG